MGLTGILVQLTGFAAIVLALTVPQLNRRTLMLLVDIGAAALWATHFALLGAWTGTAMNMLSAARGVAFRAGLHRNAVLIVFCALFAVGALVTGLLGDGWLALLPLTGMIVGTIGFWQHRPLGIRIASLVSAPMWLTYNTIKHSVPGVLIEVFLLVSALAGIYRHDIRKKASAAPEPS